MATKTVRATTAKAAKKKAKSKSFIAQRATPVSYRVSGRKPKKRVAKRKRVKKKTRRKKK